MISLSPGQVLPVWIVVSLLPRGGWRHATDLPQPTGPRRHHLKELCADTAVTDMQMKNITISRYWNF
jgi:hypothetical protein